MSNENNECTVINVSMPLAEWRVVVAYLEGGVFRDVCPILTAIWLQTQQQLEAAQVTQALKEREQQAMNSKPAGSTAESLLATINGKLN